MKTFPVNTLIALALCHMNVYASHDIAEISASPTSSVNTEQFDQKHIDVLEHVEAIAKGRYQYNAYLLEEMTKTDGSLTISDKISYYKHLSGLDFTNFPQVTYDHIITAIDGVLYRYKFIINFINSVKESQDKNEINILYTIINCLYKIEFSRISHFHLIGHSKNDDSFEMPFLKEISVSLNNLTIAPAYKLYQNYITYIDAKRVAVIFQQSQVWKNLRERDAILSGRREAIVNLLTKDYVGTMGDTDYSLLELTLLDHRKLAQEINDHIIAHLEEHKKNPPDFSDLEALAKYMRVIPESMHELMKKCLQTTLRYTEISAFYDSLISAMEERNAEIATQEALKKKLKAEEREQAKEACRKKFEEVQTRLQREYEKRREGYEAAAAAEAAALKAKREAEALARQKAAEEKAAVADTEVSNYRAGPKVKTKGVARPGEDIQAPTEPLAPVVRVIPEDVKDFVADVMQLDFENVKSRFSKFFGDNSVVCKNNNKWEFSFRSPVNNELLRFYADNPHGVQNEKFRTAWRELMKNAFERGEMKVR